MALPRLRGLHEVALDRLASHRLGGGQKGHEILRDDLSLTLAGAHKRGKVLVVPQVRLQGRHVGPSPVAGRPATIGGNGSPEEDIVPESHAQSLYPSGAAGRPSKIAIIGAGAVGTAVAYACLMRGDARHIVLQDINKAKVEAEALDMAHGIQFTPSGSIEGSDDVEIVRGADLVIVTAGAKQKPGQSRLELAASTVDLMKKIVPGLQNVAPNALYMFITNPVDVVTYVAMKLMDAPRNQVFGSGTVLDTSRLRYLVSLETGVATQNIHAYVAGEHGDSEVALWSSAEIGNVPLRHWGPTLSGGLFDNELRSRIATEVVQSAYKIIEGKGATNFAIGLSASNIARAVLRDESRVLTISTLLEDWEGISDVCMAAPTIVGREGAGRVLNPPLTLGERDGLTASAERLRQAARDLGF